MKYFNLGLNMCFLLNHNIEESMVPEVPKLPVLPVMSSGGPAESQMCQPEWPGHILELLFNSLYNIYNKTKIFTFLGGNFCLQNFSILFVYFLS